jgi:drug/metabolite transporter (DMT)-like permease
MSGSAPQGRRWPTLVGAIGIIVWASETVLIKLAGALPPIEMVALAFGAGTLASAIVGLATGRLEAAIFRQPLRAWLVIVPSLVGYHACIYFAVQRAPAAPAALLQGCTPLLIVLGSALLPGEQLRWWHWAGALFGLLGAVALVGWGGDASFEGGEGSTFALILIAIAAGLWGIYSLAARTLAGVPSAAMGVFFAAAGMIAGILHFALEPTVMPSPGQWAAIVALGTLPMGLALYFWDYGVKRGDLQALSAFSYFEPFIGALLVAALGQGMLGWNVAVGGALIVGGAILASRGLWMSQTVLVTGGPG